MEDKINVYSCVANANKYFKEFARSIKSRNNQYFEEAQTIGTAFANIVFAARLKYPGQVTGEINDLNITGLFPIANTIVQLMNEIKKDGKTSQLYEIVMNMLIMTVKRQAGKDSELNGLSNGLTEYLNAMDKTETALNDELEAAVVEDEKNLKTGLTEKIKKHYKKDKSARKTNGSNWFRKGWDTLINGITWLNYANAYEKFAKWETQIREKQKKEEIRRWEKKIKNRAGAAMKNMQKEIITSYENEQKRLRDVFNNQLEEEKHIFNERDEECNAECDEELLEKEK